MSALSRWAIVVAFFFLLLADLASVSAQEDDAESVLSMDADSNTFQSMGTVGGSTSTVSEDGVSYHGDYKLTEVVCDGTKCEKLTKQEKEARAKRQATSRPSNQIKFESVRRILHVEHGSSLYPALVEDGVPTLIQNAAPTTQWTAFDTWDFLYLADLWGYNHLLGPILTSNSSVPGMRESIVLFFNHTADAGWPNVPKPYSEKGMEVGAFFSGQCSKTSPETWWYSKSLDPAADPTLDEATQPRDFFRYPHASENNTAPDPTFHLVTGSRNAAMHLHYDLDDTFIVQVHRFQQILLFSPEQMHKMYLYPWIHPHRRRSQVMPITTATNEKFPGIGEIKAIEAILEPKDILYIPRYWGYHIVNQAPGIAVHVNSPVARDLQYDFRRHLISFNTLEPMKKLSAAKLAIRRIVEPLLYELDKKAEMRANGEELNSPIQFPEGYEFPRTRLRHYLKEHAKQRYSKLPNYDPDGLTKLEKLALMKSNCREARLPRNQLATTDEMKISMGLLRTMETWREIKDDHVRRLFMADWIDFIAYQAVGHKYAEAFIRRCF